MSEGMKTRIGEDYPPTTFQPDYKTGRMLARAISLLGWLTIFVGVISALFALIGGSSLTADEGQKGFTALGLAVVLFLSGSIGGVILVAAGHAMRAVMDMANATREMLSILREG